MSAKTTPWQERPITDWPTFAKIAETLTSPLPHQPNWLFRGHSRAKWTLDTRLLRELTDRKATRAEAVAIEDRASAAFIQQAHIPIDHPALDPQFGHVARWAIMAHHGVPTRLLDWTASIYVAAYFACCEHNKADAAVWVLNNSSLQAVNTKRGKPFPEKPGEQATQFLSVDDTGHQLYAVQGRRKTKRMVAQQAYFTVCSDVLTTHEDALLNAVADGFPKDDLVKLTIPAHLKVPLRKQLVKMNITAGSLFPDLDGLGRNLAEQIRFEADRLPTA